jgi:hypothetical protein
VLVAADSPLFRGALAASLSGLSGIVVTGEVESLETAPSSHP